MFYDYEITKLIEKTVIDEELFIESVKLTDDYTFMADVQPSNQNVEKSTFGEIKNIEFIIFADADIELGDKVRYNNKVYRIENKIDWLDYKIYGVVSKWQ